MFEVVAGVGDAFSARDAIVKYRPDVMTLDVEMPKINGIEFLRQLLPQYHIPVIMVSSLNNAVFDALSVGAVDFVNKPNCRTEKEISDFVKNELLEKLRIAAGVKGDKIANKSKIVGVNKKKVMPKNNIVKTNNLNVFLKYRIVAIGASTGGTNAIVDVVKEFHEDIPGTVIVQHMPPGFTAMFAERLDKLCPKLSVKEAQDGDIVETGKVFVAAGDKHMRVVNAGGKLQIKCSYGEKVSGHCPSVDVLFDSVADAAKSSAIGVILTGMGADGAKGLLKMREAGAETIGQNEATCVVYGMPKVAYQIGAVKYQVALNDVAAKVYSILRTH